MGFVLFVFTVFSQILLNTNQKQTWILGDLRGAEARHDKIEMFLIFVFGKVKQVLGNKHDMWTHLEEEEGKLGNLLL